MKHPALKQRAHGILWRWVFKNLLCWGVQTLSQQFPESDWIVAQAAVAQYNLRNFDGAQELFEDLIERDPHRVEVKPSPKALLWLDLSFRTLTKAAPQPTSGQVTLRSVLRGLPAMQP